MIWVNYDEVWKRISAAAVEAEATRIAAQVDVGSVDAKVGVKMQESMHGAPVALVTIMHPAGKAIQAKHGALTQAAAACGYEVHTMYLSKAGKRSKITAKQAANYRGANR